MENRPNEPRLVLTEKEERLLDRVEAMLHPLSLRLTELEMTCPSVPGHPRQVAASAIIDRIPLQRHADQDRHHPPTGTSDEALEMIAHAYGAPAWYLTEIDHDPIRDIEYGHKLRQLRTHPDHTPTDRLRNHYCAPDPQPSPDQLNPVDAIARRRTRQSLITTTLLGTITAALGLIIATSTLIGWFTGEPSDQNPIPVVLANTIFGGIAIVLMVVAFRDLKKSLRIGHLLRLHPTPFHTRIQQELSAHLGRNLDALLHAGVDPSLLRQVICHHPVLGIDTLERCTTPTLARSTSHLIEDAINHRHYPAPDPAL